MDNTTNEGTIQIKTIGVITNNSLAKIAAHRSSGSIHRCFHLISRRVDDLLQKGITFE